MKDHWNMYLDESAEERESADRDDYYDALEAFWYKHRTIEKDWEELNWYEVDQVKRDYAKHKQDMEQWSDPECFFGVSR